jgi:ABC-type Na+ efflux pump permease subunit
VNPRHLWLVARKDLRGIGKERTILLAIFLQLFIALFSSFLMVGLASFYSPDTLDRIPGAQYAIAYTGNDSAIERLLLENRDFRVYRMDFSEAVAALGERKLSAVVYVPDTAPDAEEPVKISLYVLQNDIQAAVVQVKIRDVLLAYEDELRDIRSDRIERQPFPLEIPPASGSGDFYLFIYGLLVPLLLFMPAIISATLIIDLITEEYQNRTLETLLSTPLTMSDVVWGKILACTLIVPLQAGAWLLLLRVNGIAVAGTPAILLHVSAASLVLILVGALIALFYRERTAAQFIFSFAAVGALFLLLAFPGNPLNTVTLLATGSAGPGHWGLLLGITVAAFGLGLVVDRYARSTVTRHLTD